MKSHVRQVKEELPLVLVFIAVIWGVFILDRILPLEQWGLVPRDIGGLAGIFTMPFLHSDWGHIVSNTMPLLILLTLLAGSKANSRLIVAGIMLLSGGLLWLFGRGSSLHIGASGLVFGLAVFLIVSGILEKRLVPLLVAVLVVFLYGSSLLTGIMPFQQGVSWDGHLFGGLAGGLMAWTLVRREKASG